MRLDPAWISSWRAELPTSGRRLRIWEKIFERCRWEEGPLVSPCLVWQGPTSGQRNGCRKTRGGGYARMCIDGATVAVHRAVFILIYGPIPPKKQIDHRCHNRRCVNHRHLEMVTHKENQRRRDRKRMEDDDARADSL